MAGIYQADYLIVQQATPVFLPGKSHGQRSLAGYSHRVAESDITEATEHAHMHTVLIRQSLTVWFKISFLGALKL